MDKKKLRETTNFFVEIMNSKRQVKWKHGHVEQIRVYRYTKTQGFYRSWKTWKVMKFKNFIFPKFNFSGLGIHGILKNYRSLKVMEK